MNATYQSGNWAFEKADEAKLEAFVSETVSAMAKSTSMQPEEVLDILENIHVEMVGELREAVEALGGKKALMRVDTAKLTEEIEKAIEAISNATALDTEEITDIFSNKPGASIADVASRLHAKSMIDRDRCE